MREVFADLFKTSPEKIFLFSKGRVGLYALLKAMGIGEGDEVIVPGYTCVVVPSACMFAGAKCQYVDILPENYNLNPNLLDLHYTKKTKALIVQHTYGIALDMDPVIEWAKQKKIPIIEDCCHAFGTKYKGKLCGTFGKGAFFSGQWNKPFSTGLGGMLIVNDASLDNKVKKIWQNAKTPSILEEFILAVQILAYNKAVNPRTNALITRIYRVLSKLGIAIGSSSNRELMGKMPEDYLKRMANVQVKEGLKNLTEIEQEINHRKKITGFYSRELSKIGLKPLPEPGDSNNVLLRYPMRVGNKEELLLKALKGGIELGSWFEIPLHPKGIDMAYFGYNKGMCPEAEKASLETVNLPTHGKIDEKEAQRVLRFIDKNSIKH